MFLVATDPAPPAAIAEPQRTRYRCSNGHEWVEEGPAPAVAYRGPDREHLCPRCFRELLARHLGRVELVGPA